MSMRIVTPAGNTGMAWIGARPADGRGQAQNSGSQSTVTVPVSKSTAFT